MTDQIRRAAVSVPSNIAEGQAHFSKREYLHFQRHSRGSLAEVETQILIAHRQKYLNDAQVALLLKQADEVSRILSGLINSLKEKSVPSCEKETFSVLDLVASALLPYLYRVA